MNNSVLRGFPVKKPSIFKRIGDWIIRQVTLNVTIPYRNNHPVPPPHGPRDPNRPWAVTRKPRMKKQRGRWWCSQDYYFRGQNITVLGTGVNWREAYSDFLDKKGRMMSLTTH